jgi:hypothetical protein
MEPVLRVIHVHIIILHRHVSVTPVTFIRVSYNKSTVSTQTTVSGSLCVCVCVCVCVYSMCCTTPWWWHLHMSKPAQAMDGRSGVQFVWRSRRQWGLPHLLFIEYRVFFGTMRMSGAVPLLAVLPWCCAQEQLCVELCRLFQVAVSCYVCAFESVFFAYGETVRCPPVVTPLTSHPVVYPSVWHV